MARYWVSVPDIEKDDLSFKKSELIREQERALHDISLHRPTDDIEDARKIKATIQELLKKIDDLTGGNYAEAHHIEITTQPECPKCGNFGRFRDQYCPKCGTELTASQIIE